MALSPDILDRGRLPQPFAAGDPFLPHGRHDGAIPTGGRRLRSDQPLDFSAAQRDLDSEIPYGHKQHISETRHHEEPDRHRDHKSKACTMG